MSLKNPRPSPGPASAAPGTPIRTLIRLASPPAGLCGPATNLEVTWASVEGEDAARASADGPTAATPTEANTSTDTLRHGTRPQTTEEDIDISHLFAAGDNHLLIPMAAQQASSALEASSDEGSATPTLNTTNNATTLETPKVTFDDDDNSFFRQVGDNVILELDLPVTNAASDFGALWETQVANIKPAANPNPMACFNPLHVEGKEQPIVKKRRAILPKLYIPPPPVKPEPAVDVAPSNPPVMDTPAVEKVLGDEVSQTGFDLLEWVTNTELPVNDPGFLAMIGNDDTPNDLATVDPLDIACQPSTSKGKWRPAQEEEEEEVKPKSR